MGVVVDASVLVAGERSRKTNSSGTLLTWSSLLGRLANESALPPAAVHAELPVRVALASNEAQTEARRARIDALVATRVPAIYFDASIARHWTPALGSLRRYGEPIPAYDLAVAGTALHLDSLVLVGPSGEGHRHRVAGLVVEQS